MANVFLCILLCIPVIATAADTKTVTSRTGNCTLAIPSDWNFEQLVSTAQSPDKKITVTVTSPSHGLSTLAEVEQTAPSVYKDDKVTKKTSSEFEMEGKSVTGKPNVYRAIPAGAKVCIAEIMYESGTAADARAIIETMKAK